MTGISSEEAASTVGSGGFDITLPPGWIGIALNESAPGDLERLVASARSRAGVPVGALDDLARAGELSLRELLQQAARTGAVYTALYLGWQPDGRMTPAQLVIAIRRFGPSVDPVELLDALRGRSPGQSDQLHQSGRVDERVASLVMYVSDPPAEQDLPREAVVVRRAGLVEGDDGQAVLSHQYYFPVPGDKENLALLDFSSRALSAAPQLGEMFESMAASFRFTGSR